MGRKVVEMVAVVLVLAMATPGAAAAPFNAPAWGVISVPEGYAGTLFVWGGQLFGSQSGGVFRSVDAGVSWAPIHGGLPNSYVRAFAVSPDDPEIMLAAPEGQGIFRSEDGGGVWEEVLPGVTVYRLEVDGADHDLVFAGCEGRGIFRSVDFGLTWEEANTGLKGLNVTSMSVSAASPARLVISYEGLNTGGVMISDDGGSTWEDRSPTNQRQTSVLISPADEDLIFVGNGGPWSSSPYGINVSDDAGASWESYWPTDDKDDVLALHVPPALPSRLMVGTQVWLDPWLPRILISDDDGQTLTPVTGIPDVQTGIVDMDTSPTDSDVIYAVGAQNLGVIVSTDGGGSWTNHQLGLTGSNPNLVFRAIATDPTDPLVVYAGGVGLYRSSDGGTSWGLVADTGEDGGDVYSMEVSAAGDLLIGGLGTFFVSDDGGASFVETSGGLPAAALIRLEVVTSGVGSIFAVVSGDGVYRLPDGAATWGPIGPFGEDIPVIVGRISDGDTVIAAGAQDVYYSLDAGQTWLTATVSGGTFFGARVISRDPDDGQSALLGTSYGVYTTDDGGETWGLDNPAGLPTDPSLGAIERDPDDPSRILVSIAGDLFDPNGDVYLSEDSGGSFISSGAGIPPELAGAITSFAYLPGASHKIWCAVGDGFSGTQGFYHTHDGAMTWAEPAPYVDLVAFDETSLALDPGEEYEVGLTALDHAGESAVQGFSQMIAVSSQPGTLLEMGSLEFVQDGVFVQPLTAGASQGAGDLLGTCDGCAPSLADSIPVTVGDVLPDGGIPDGDGGADGGGGGSSGCGCEVAGVVRRVSLLGLFAAALF